MPLPLHGLKSRPRELRKEIAEDLEALRSAREQQDDLGAALIEDHMNTLLDELKEASGA